MTYDERRGGPTMQRITITIDDELVAALDRVIAACGYQNRSEAIRDLAGRESPSSKSRAITAVRRGGTRLRL